MRDERKILLEQEKLKIMENCSTTVEAAIDYDQ
jgi:hypothetical protein